MREASLLRPDRARRHVLAAAQRAYPLLVFSNAMAGADRAQVEANWGAMLLTAVMYALLILVFRLVAWALRLKGSRSHVFQAALIFGNAGFIGIPIIMALWPHEARSTSR